MTSLPVQPSRPLRKRRLEWLPVPFAAVDEAAKRRDARIVGEALPAPVARETSDFIYSP